MQIPSNLFLNKIGKPAIYLPVCVSLRAIQREELGRNSREEELLGIRTRPHFFFFSLVEKKGGGLPCIACQTTDRPFLQMIIWGVISAATAGVTNFGKFLRHWTNKEL
jgi:hypothetical protein